MSKKKFLEEMLIFVSKDRVYKKMKIKIEKELRKELEDGQKS